MTTSEGNTHSEFTTKILPVHKDTPTSSKFMLGNNFHDTIGVIEASQKKLQNYSNSPYYKNSENLQRFPKRPGNQNKW